MESNEPSESKPTRRKAITAWIEPELYALMRQCCTDQDRTVSSLLRHALRGYLSRYGYKVSK
jgi:hypothetical protein